MGWTNYAKHKGPFFVLYSYCKSQSTLAPTWNAKCFPPNMRNRQVPILNKSVQCIHFTAIERPATGQGDGTTPMKGIRAWRLYCWDITMSTERLLEVVNPARRGSAQSVSSVHQGEKEEEGKELREKMWKETERVMGRDFDWDETKAPWRMRIT